MGMDYTRRDVLRLMGATAAGAAMLGAMGRVTHALSTREDPPALIWFNEGASDLNLLTLMGQEVPGFLELVLTHWDMRSHPSLFLAPDAIPPSRGAPILVMETIPPIPANTPTDGAVGTAFQELVGQARAVLLVGTDACYGGLSVDLERVKALDAMCKTLRTPVVRLPGVPVPPHHIVGILGHLEFFGFPRLDALGRPEVFYGETICAGCERRTDFETGRHARNFGEEGCLIKLGCRGPLTYNSCARVRWNGGENWCVGAGGPCTGCSEPGYPDHGGLGLHGALSSDFAKPSSPWWPAIRTTGFTLLGITIAGSIIQWARHLLHGEEGSKGGEA